MLECFPLLRGRRTMPIRRITHDNGTLQVELLDDTGAAVPEVAAFLHHLAAREYSPNTLVAYAHDLQHLWRFLASSGRTWTHLQPPMPWTCWPTCGPSLVHTSCSVWD